MSRLALFYLLAVLIAVPLNLVPLRMLSRMFPRARALMLTGALAGNVFWLFAPWLMRVPSTGLTRLGHAIIGPAWCFWTLLLLSQWLILALIVLLWLPVSRRSSFHDFARRVVAVELMLTATVLLIGGYQALVPIRVERVPVKISGLPPQLDGLRIVQMSDLHVGFFSRPSRLHSFSRVVRSLQPDVCVISGDLLDDDPYYAPKLLEGLTPIEPGTPIIAVLGNHEMYGNPREVIRELRGSRIRLLVNEHVLLEHRGVSLAILGLSDFAASQRPGERDLLPDIGTAMSGLPSGVTRILLAHQPKAFAAAQAAHIPLTIVGHTHGGQFAIRPLHWSLAGVFLPFDMGLYRRGSEQLYVNTGTGFWMLPFRFGVSPEITLLELKRE